MSRISRLVATLLVAAPFVPASLAQRSGDFVVPRLVKFSGALKDAAANPITGTTANVTFSLYKEREGGQALWSENQDVTLDSEGNFSVLLGSSNSDGLPIDLFASGESRWLGVQANGQSPQSRVLLVSVPYALKAGDAQTLGGLPLSSFVLADPKGSGTTSSGQAAPSVGDSAKQVVANISGGAIGGTGTQGRIAKWLDNAGTLGDSAIREDAFGNVGIGVTPGFHFDVEATATATSGADVSFFGLNTANPPSDTTAAYLSSWYIAKTQAGNPANFHGMLYSFAPQTYHEGTGTVDLSYTVSTWSQNSGTGTITEIHGLDVWGANASTGTIGTFQGIRIHNMINGGGGTLSNNYGIYIDPITTGSVKNFNIYSAGSKNYFSGNVGIGTETPSAPLEVASGDIKISGIGNGLRFPDGSKQVSATSIGPAGPTGSTGVQGATGSVGPTGPTGPGGATLGTNTFVGTQTINSGNLALQDSSPSTGVVTLGGVRFLHDFGTDNVFVGTGAGNFSMTGGSNTALGKNALSANAAGAFGTAVGLNALSANTSGAFNTAAGVSSLQSNTTGSNNTATGAAALQFNTTGNANTASGSESLASNTTGSNNSAFGTSALKSNTTGGLNTASGVQALFANATGSSNTALGYQTLLGNVSGDFNTAAGVQVLFSNTTGALNTASGGQALFFNITGNSNTAQGYSSMTFNLTGSSNTAVGDHSLFVNSSGDGNTAIGVQTLSANVSGTGNVAVGIGAGVTTVPASALTAGANNTFLGSNSGPGAAAALINTTAIGANAVVSADNSLVLGSISGVNGATASVNVGIGTAAPSKPLDVVGDIRTTTCILSNATVVGGTCSSDARLKKNIEPFPSTLEKILRLRPVTYNWRAEEHPEYRFGNERTAGLIAQEVESEFPDMVSTDERGFKAVNYSKLPLLLLQALRELKAEKDRDVRELRGENEGLKADNQLLRAELGEAARLREEVRAMQAEFERFTKEMESAGGTAARLRFRGARF